jgi:hypothetical protein
MQQQHDPEITECRNCSAEFDLARQHYYDDQCPSCVDEDRASISCTACSNEMPRDEVSYAVHKGRHGSETVPVCSAGCKAHIEQPRGAPRSPELDKGQREDGSYVGDS